MISSTSKKYSFYLHVHVHVHVHMHRPSNSSKRVKKTEDQDTAIVDSKVLTLSCPVCLETVPQVTYNIYNI